MLRSFTTARAIRLLAAATAVAHSASSATSAYAQVDEPRPRVETGVFYGINSSTLSDISASFLYLNGPSHRERRNGSNGGFSIKVPVNYRYSIQGELHYEQGGVTIVRDDTSATSLALRIDYLEFPVMIRADFGRDFARIHPWIMTGASYAYRVNCQLELKSKTVGGYQACNFGEADQNPLTVDQFRQFDVRAIGAIGAAINSADKTYSVQLRYSYGLMNLANGPEAASFNPRSRAVAVLFSITR